jgi:hypothetical protein
VALIKHPAGENFHLIFTYRKARTTSCLGLKYEKKPPERFTIGNTRVSEPSEQNNYVTGCHHRRDCEIDWDNLVYTLSTDRFVQREGFSFSFALPEYSGFYKYPLS